MIVAMVALCLCVCVCGCVGVGVGVGGWVAYGEGATSVSNPKKLEELDFCDLLPERRSSCGSARQMP